VSKFNRTGTRTAVFSPVTTETTPSGTTYEGAPGYARDPRSELFLLAVSNMVGEQTFYEAAGERDNRYSALVRKLAVDDPEWTGRFLRWLRGEGNLRSASIVGAAEFAKGRLDTGADGHSRQVVASVCQRADEPGELLAYWTSAYGRAVPKPVKRGVADAAARLYDERSLLKYDSDTRGFRFGDVLELAHPSPRADWQGDLFAHAISRRHDRDEAAPESLTMLRARAELMALPVEQRRDVLTDPERLRAAGMTWESLAGWLQGPMDATAWQAVIPSMGYMALLRNLRNFDEAGVGDDVAAKVAAKLADPEQVARSRQLPMRFLSAYKAAPSLRWAWALEQALGHSLSNVPALSGRTLILVDMSASMSWAHLSGRSELTYAAAAAVFGSALALRCDQADLVRFGSDSQPVPFKRGESVLRIVQRFGGMGSTQTAAAIRRHYARHDRVVIVTDEQVWGGWLGEQPTAVVPGRVPVYTWNLAGYKHGHGPSGSANRHTFGGLSDAAFRMVPLLEAGQNAAWPF
jgi:hypothetical protein